MTFELSPLSYAYDALEPYIDEKTMEIHHDKHHQAYVNNLNAALAKLTKSMSDKSIEGILEDISAYPTAVRNNAGGHYNHALFWNLIKPGGRGTPTGKLKDAIDNAFGSFDSFKTIFASVAIDQFGSGWVWLIAKNSGDLELCSTPNQDNPLMDIVASQGYPILALDVWEHAYYLKHQNKRADYVKGWWNVINWDVASFRFDHSLASSTKGKSKDEKVSEKVES